MVSVTSREIQSNFLEILERVRNGEQIIITSGKKRVARIVPESASADRVRRAVNGLRALQSSIKERIRNKGSLSLSIADVRSAIERGRK
jgi:prevent-host-death family protein